MINSAHNCLASSFPHAFLIDYGDDVLSQIKRKAKSLCIDFDEAMNIAWIVHQEKLPRYDASVGGLQNYLWGHLNAALKRTGGALYGLTVSLDDDSDLANQLIETLQAEEPEPSAIPLDPYNLAIPNDPVLIKLLADTEAFSGKTTSEIAAERGCSRRNVNYQLKKLIAIAEKYAKKKRNQ